MPTVPLKDDSANLTSVLLKEYEDLRAEERERLSSCYNMGIAYFGAVGAYVALAVHEFLPKSSVGMQDGRELLRIFYVLLFPLLNFLYVQLTVNSILVIWRIRQYLLALELRLSALHKEPVLGWQAFMRGGKEMHPNKIYHLVGTAQVFLYGLGIAVSGTCCICAGIMAIRGPIWSLVLVLSCSVMTVLALWNCVFVGMVARRTMLAFRRRWEDVWEGRKEYAHISDCG